MREIYLLPHAVGKKNLQSSKCSSYYFISHIVCTAYLTLFLMKCNGSISCVLIYRSNLE